MTYRVNPSSFAHSRLPGNPNDLNKDLLKLGNDELANIFVFLGDPKVNRTCRRFSDIFPQVACILIQECYTPAGLTTIEPTRETSSNELKRIFKNLVCKIHACSCKASLDILQATPLNFVRAERILNLHIKPKIIIFQSKKYLPEEWQQHFNHQPLQQRIWFESLNIPEQATAIYRWFLENNLYTQNSD